MEKKDIPQDPSSLSKFTKEVCYATDESGKYTTGLSSGWEVKATALGVTWEDAKSRVVAAREKVLNGEASPVLFFMELRLMDIGIVSSYTGFWKWQIKRHMKANVFNKLSEKKLQKYAEVFDVNIEQLKNMRVNEDQF